MKKFLLNTFLIIFLSASFLPAFSLDSLDFELAVNLYNAERYKKALRAIEKIEKEGGMDAAMALLRFEILKKQNKMKEAKEALKLALEYDPECFEAYIALAILEIENSNTKEAKNYFEKAIDLSPDIANSPDLMYYYAKLCIIDKDFDSAFEYVLQAIEEQPDEPLYYLELGKIYLYKKEYLRAVNALEYAIGSDEAINAECYNYLGLSNYRRDNFTQAKKYFELAVEKEPENMLFLNNLALCEKSLGNNQEYEKIINKLTNLTPKTHEDFIHLSQIYFSENNREMALKTLQEGLKLYPDNLVLKKLLSELNKS